MKIGKIKPFDIERFLASLMQDGARHDKKPGGYSIGTIRKIRNILSSIMSSAERLEIIESSPVRKARLPKCEPQEEKVKCFTLDETRRFLQFLDNDYEQLRKAKRHVKDNAIISMQDYTNADVLDMQYKVFFQIAVFGGLRKGEITALEWKAIDFDHNIIHVRQSAYRNGKQSGIKTPKTRSSIRDVVLPAPVLHLLEEYRQAQDRYRKSIGNKWHGNDWVFIKANGDILNMGQVYNRLHTLITRYNQSVPEDQKLPMITVHGLRHTNASLLVSSNKTDIKSVSQKLGHSDTAITLKYYVHSYDENEKQTAEILEEMLIDDDQKRAASR